VDLCGEESFGTSSSHAREKDGLWAVLFWLNLVAVTGRPVDGLVTDHWDRFGRHAFARHDWYIADGAQAALVMRELESNLDRLAGAPAADTHVDRADSFSYRDPVDGSLAVGQGHPVVPGGWVTHRLPAVRHGHPGRHAQDLPGALSPARRELPGQRAGPDRGARAGCRRARQDPRIDRGRKRRPESSSLLRPRRPAGD
jgi:hypothetical protein